MRDDAADDLFGDELDADDAPEFEQEGPDLFGLEPGQVHVSHEPAEVAQLDLDVEQDEMDEIPIDPTDEPENQVTPAELSAGQEAPEREVQEEAPTTAAGPADAAERIAAPALAEQTAAAASDRPARHQAPPAASHRPDAPLALYRRYRPDTFAEVIGQDHVTDPLRRALVNNRVNHAYLFSGPRGCGKTTSARILARCLNCEQGPTPEPCGVCQSCRDLARGGTGSIDVIEIDAASHGGVNEARDLRERAFFAPVHSRYKIYIIDEAHMVTKEGFNALLKLVEEPPPHVKFIFATTEPEKVLGTIRSRTHHYPFRLVPPKVLSGYLHELCAAEGVEVDAAVLPLVVRAGAGSVRDSLSVLDQLLGAAGDGGVSYQQATALLGYTPDTLLDEIMDAFAAGDAQGVFACVDKVIEVGQDPRRFAEDLLRRLRDLIIVVAVPDALASGLVDVAADQGERLTVQAKGMGAGELTRAAEVIAKGLTDMRGTTAPRLHLELMCSRVLLPGADVDARGVHARLDRLERRLNMVGEGAARPDQAPAPGDVAPPSRPAGRQGAPAGPADSPREAVASEASSVRPSASAASGAPRTQSAGAPGRAGDSAPVSPSAGGSAVGADQSGHGAQQSAGGAERSVEAAVHPIDTAGEGPPGRTRDPGSMSTADVRRMWPQILDAVKGRRRVTWIVLSQNAQVHTFHNGVLMLAMSSAGARESFGRGGSPDILREALIEVLGIAPTIETMVSGGGPIPGVREQAPAPREQAPGGRGQRVGHEPAAPETAGSGTPASRGSAAAPSDTSTPTAASAPASGADRSGEGQQTQQPQQQAGRAAAVAPAPGAAPASDGGPAAPRAGTGPGARTGRPAPSVPTPEPPPEEDDERPSFASLAKENIRKTQVGPTASEPEAPQDRDDEDLADVPDVDELIKKELGAELILDDQERP